MTYEIKILVNDKWIIASKASTISAAKGLESQYKLGGYKTKVCRIRY